jgi:hypothetical protein
MTEQEAKRWAECRVHGRLHYTLRSGLRFAASFGFAMGLLHLLQNNSVPWMVPALVTVVASTFYTLVAFFRWNYQELQFFLFNQAQACS